MVLGDPPVSREDGQVHRGVRCMLLPQRRRSSDLPSGGMAAVRDGTIPRWSYEFPLSPSVWAQERGLEKREPPRSGAVGKERTAPYGGGSSGGRKGEPPRFAGRRDKCRFLVRAGDGARTHDILLGKQTLYQLSYTRTALWPPARASIIGLPNVAVNGAASDQRGTTTLIRVPSPGAVWILRLPPRR